MANEVPVKGLYVLDPTSQPGPERAHKVSRPSTLDGKVLGLLDNSKTNSGRILDTVSALLAKRYRLERVVTRRKPNASRGAPEPMLDEIASESDFVITGVGD